MTGSPDAAQVVPRPVVTGPVGAPVLVLSNSLGTDHRMWEPQVAALSERFRVVRYDVRGHGSATSPPGPYTIADLGRDLLAMLDELGVELAHLAGLSLGGMIAMWVAANAPERVDRVALLATSARLGPPELWARRAETVLGEGMDAVCEAVTARWFTPAYAAAHGDVVDRMRTMFRASDPAGYAGCCRAIETMDLTADLPRIRARTLVVVGTDDPATPPSHAEAIVAAVPGAHLVLVPDAAHLVNIEQADVVTRELLAHLSADEPEGPR
jgi:3-oxoadipate enol-lactonase